MWQRLLFRTYKKMYVIMIYIPKVPVKREHVGTHYILIFRNRLYLSPILTLLMVFL